MNSKLYKLGMDYIIQLCISTVQQYKLIQALYNNPTRTYQAPNTTIKNISKLFTAQY